MGRIENTKDGLTADMDELSALLASPAEPLSLRQAEKKEPDPAASPPPSPGAAPPAEGLERTQQEAATSQEVQEAEAAKRPRPQPSRAGGSNASSWGYLGNSRYRLPSGRERLRPSFFIRPDHLQAIKVHSALRTPLGKSDTEVVGAALDLLGLNGTLAVPGVTPPPEGIAVPDRLIEERQWLDLLAAAKRCCREEEREGAEGVPAAQLLSAVSFLVQEALYEAGYGDKRRRRSTFNR